MTKSSGSAKSKEQREVERRKRQLEKLPSPVALHDLQYPMEKSVVNDQDFQRPVYADDLDTPELYSPVPPDDFFVTWNIRDCGRTVYPPVPHFDHRHVRPQQVPEWEEHKDCVIDYLHKHQIVPGMFPAASIECNLSVTFSDAKELTRENFWMTAHCGNFIELKHCQKAPQVQLLSPVESRDELYTLILASPDYPSRSSPNKGFFLHWVCCNLGCSAEVDEKVAYVPPLPTEDAGSARVLCFLLKQSKRLESGLVDLPFDVRRDFRLHDEHRRYLRDLDSVVDVTAPRAVTFFQTVWDIQVQEWYEGAGLPEPAYVPDDIEDILAVNALPEERFQISSKTLPDGSMDTRSKIRIQQHGETV
eukprot:CAMPEP_0174877054 /NCGR_PEP_ID=MMETSP1114-20130205/81215_1 /TAXON_ID=312471 /ORGANISM="Neobodo designis, Strain CCAP 1951/1" /LENGTH=360 /DNA_ID=CAMNT_0016112427 /DNA_START=95 /DNA_END=1173 /DNA_ORIENTATION=+